MNSDWSACFKMEVMFFQIFGRICFALAPSSHWYRPDDSYVKAKCPRNQAWVRHSMSGLWNHISGWNMTFQLVAHFEVSIGDQFLSVTLEFWHVNNSGLCTSHLVKVLSRCMVTEAWYTDCVSENHRQNILNHYWYVVLFKKLSFIPMWW